MDPGHSVGDTAISGGLATPRATPEVDDGRAKSEQIRRQNESSGSSNIVPTTENQQEEQVFRKLLGIEAGYDTNDARQQAILDSLVSIALLAKENPEDSAAQVKYQGKSVSP